MARTANRGTMSASSPTSYNVMRWRLGKYIRLSKEDLLRGRDESNSVVNQRRLLEQYHQAHLDEFYEGAEAEMCIRDSDYFISGCLKSIPSCSLRILKATSICGLIHLFR